MKSTGYHATYVRNRIANEPGFKEKRLATHSKYRKNTSQPRAEAYIAGIKSISKCILCGESTDCCLVFHHRDPSKKNIGIARAMTRGWSVHKLEKEIAKCDILCANCHRKLHWGKK